MAAGCSYSVQTHCSPPPWPSPSSPFPYQPNLPSSRILLRGALPAVRRSLNARAAAIPSPSHSPPTGSLAIKDVPGSYGPPLLGLLQDRLNYFILQGRDDFFYNLMRRHGSTVVRVNMPPGPPMFPDSRVVMLLDQRSIKVLFDTGRVEKRNVFAGTYMPDTEFTGGYRVLPYLDPSEPQHGVLKAFCFEILRANGRRWVPEFRAAFDEATHAWDAAMSSTGRADFTVPSQHLSLNFLCRSILATDPARPGPASLGDEGPALIQTWIAPQLAPQTSLGLPKLLEELTLHTFPLPFALVSDRYRRLYRFFFDHASATLDMAEAQFGLDRHEACHNLLFFVCFNTWGGLQLLLPSIIRRIAAAGLGLQRELAAEVRAAVEDEGGRQEITMKSLEKMELVHSTVYEVLRMDPPVPFQYGRAKEDMVVESHDAAYRVKKGELLGGYQRIAMRDPKVFAAPNSFQAKRFMGPEGRKLLHSLTWSNGPENEQPSLSNKQCAGKDFVNLIARLLVAELFLRYDFFRIDGAHGEGSRSPITFTTLKKRR